VISHMVVTCLIEAQLFPELATEMCRHCHKLHLMNRVHFKKVELQHFRNGMRLCEKKKNVTT
jgi:hypothetical protein